MAQLAQKRLKIETGIICQSNPFTSATAKGNPHLVTTYENPGIYAEYLARNRHSHETARYYTDLMGNRDGWAGNQSFSDMLTKSKTGDATLGKEAMKLLEQVKSVGLPTIKRQRIKSPVGGRACVPAFLAGSPAPMRRRKKMKSTRAPLSVFVNLVSSGGIGTTELERRGVAIAALIKSLTAMRPVTLYIGTALYFGNYSAIELVQYPTTPMDVNRLVYLCANQGFARGMGMASASLVNRRYAATTGEPAKRLVWERHNNFAFNNFAYVDKEQTSRFGSELKDNRDLGDDLGQLLNCDFLNVPGVVLGSKENAQIKADPLGWINSKLERYA